MLSLSFALLALAAPLPHASPAERCSLEHLSGCRNTSSLVLDRGFQRAMWAFAGQPRTDFLNNGEKGPLAEELIDAITGPPDKPQRISDGSYFFTACKAHQCVTKGAVVLSEKGIVAAALITPVDVDRKNPSSQELFLDIFVRRGELQQSWRKSIDDWASQATKEWRGSQDILKFRAAGTIGRVWLITPQGKLRRLER